MPTSSLPPSLPPSLPSLPPFPRACRVRREEGEGWEESPVSLVEEEEKGLSDFPPPSFLTVAVGSRRGMAGGRPGGWLV